MRDPGIRAVLIKEPWSQDYHLYMGGRSYHSTGITDDGHIIYVEGGEGVTMLEKRGIR